MDILTPLRNARDDSREPDPDMLAGGRAALLARVSEDNGDVRGTRLPRPRGRTAIKTSCGLGVAAAGLIAVVVAGDISLSAQSAYASSVLAAASEQTINYADLAPGSGEYLRARTHARWAVCGTDPELFDCVPNDQTLDVYMPADPEAEWVLYRDWGIMDAITTDGSVEVIRATGGQFYGPESSWAVVDFSDIPTDGAVAYAWIDDQYTGGSASRDEDNFVRITGILRSGLVPAAQRAALLDALSRIPGVSATDGVANLDGVIGVAIGRNEPVRLGQRQEIIIDPDTGLVIGERTVSGATVFGWGQITNEVDGLTAVETTITTETP